MPLGSVFCAIDFIDISSRGNIDVILHRLSKKGIVRFLGYGIYDVPNKSSLLGDLSPYLTDVINAYSRKMGQRLVLDPLNAANIMGITNQVPFKLTYLTDGKSHTMTICGIEINFIHASPKKIAGANTPIGIVIQALRYFGLKGAPDNVIKIIAKRLSKDDLIILDSLKNQIMRNLVKQVDRIYKFATIH